MNHDNTLYELIDRIREHIARAEKQYVLINNPEKWLSLTSGIDIIEDTSSAIEYYLDEEFPSANGGKYLFLYGLLQACFLQQDAINSIFQSLFNQTIDYKVEYPEIYAVKLLRNRVAGHPIKHCNREYIKINQISLEKDSFEYLIEEANREDVLFDVVDVIQVTQGIRRCAHEILEKAVKNLDLEEAEFQEKYRDVKMTNFFQHLTFAREKVLSDSHFREAEYKHTKSMVEECEEELTRRYGSIEAIDTYKYKLEDIHALYSLIDAELGLMPNEARKQIEYRLFELLFVKLRDLRELCAETDLVFSGEEPD